MGPLVPDIIGPNLNYVVALFIGIAFGWILEQAGFSSSRKLVGLFYGYDFTVLRVFFTAGVVAMFGIVALEHFGMIDINLIFINPSFLHSALLGGVIMGLGFVIGGFCPGTSVCAAAIGRIDAMLFVGGSLLGVLLFAEMYPFMETLYMAGDGGNARVYESIGMSKELFVLLMTAFAMLAFLATSIIEARVRGESITPLRVSRVPVVIALIGGFIAVSAYILPSQKDSVFRSTAHILSAGGGGVAIPTMTVDEFAFRLLDNDARIQIIDFRDQEEMKRLPLPKAVSFTPDNLFEKEPKQLLSRRRILNVFVTVDETTDHRLAAIALRLGLENVRVINGGIQAFESEILEFDDSLVPQSRREVDTFRFRSRASKDLQSVIASSTAAAPVRRTIQRAVGGC